MLIDQLPVGTLFYFPREIRPEPGHATAPTTIPTEHNLESFFYHHPARIFWLKTSPDGVKEVVDGAATTGQEFRWLHYYPGLIAHTDTGTFDIMSGPMSGCWIVTFIAMGVLQAGHIGTLVDQDEENSRIKSAWRLFASTYTVDLRAAYNPFRSALELGGGSVPERMEDEDGPPTFWAVMQYEAESTTYSFNVIVTYNKRAAGADRILCRVAAVYTINPATFLGAALTNIYPPVTVPLLAPAAVAHAPVVAPPTSSGMFWKRLKTAFKRR